MVTVAFDARRADLVFGLLAAVAFAAIVDAGNHEVGARLRVVGIVAIGAQLLARIDRIGLVLLVIEVRARIPFAGYAHRRDDPLLRGRGAAADRMTGLARLGGEQRLADLARLHARPRQCLLRLRLAHRLARPAP